MTSKAALPVLTGQRLRSRKRDLKEKFDPVGFRDEIIEGLSEAGGDIDKATKYLEGNTDVDYRRYAEQFFDILVAGGLLAPGGSIISDGADSNPFSCFETENTYEALKRHAEIFRALVRRYKYLQVSLEEAFTKLLKFLNGFTEENSMKLAQTTAFLFSMGLVSTKVLTSVQISSIVSSGLTLKFITLLFQTWLKTASIQQVSSALRKGGIDQKMELFFPQGQRTVSAITEHFKQAGGLDELIKWYIGQQTAEIKKDLGLEVTEMIKGGATQDELIDKVRSVQVEHRIPESEIAKLLWPAIMGAVEWNKKPELMIDQALRHVKANLKFLKRYTKSDRAQIALMVTMQEYSFVNQNFLKIYNRFCLLFYKADMLGEDAILSWYQKDHSPKGKSAFLQEMKEFVDWLNTAEVESGNED
eukprot:m.333082 g.333082  ORF g.333082 m.333082 type:complete len:416 (+) comp17065_c0_seq1:84-1331(+)